MADPGMSHSDGKTPTQNAGDSSMGIFVSLYLLLLAFFVVLNSISNQEQSRAGAVMESVNSAFKKQFAPKANFIDLLTKPDAIAPNDEFVDDVRGFLASVLGLEGRFPTDGGNLLQVNLPVSAIFETGTAALRPDRDAFIAQLTDMVLREKPGEHREVEFIFEIGARSLSVTPQPEQTLAVRRASLLADSLILEGFPVAGLSTGIVPGAAETIRVVFRSRVQNAGAVTFKDASDGRAE